MNLPLYWAMIIAFGVVMYVLLDGFTLGIGLMMPFFNDKEQDLAMSVVMPTWDGNQTWLVLGAASLYGAFSKAFSTLLPALYIPLMILLLALLLRGISLEFRMKDPLKKRAWTQVFFIASVIVTLVQGILLGYYVQGFVGSDNVSPLGEFFLSPFSLMTGLSLLFGYALLGATRLIKKTTGRMNQQMYRVSQYLVWALAAMMCLVSLWTPYVHPEVKAIWFNHNHWLYLMWLPIATFGLFVSALYYLRKRHNDNLPFRLIIGMFLCPYIGFLISIYPYVIPYSMTIYQAASPHPALVFLSIGGSIMVPILLVYTGYAYHVFRGKVDDALHY